MVAIIFRQLSIEKGFRTAKLLEHMRMESVTDGLTDGHTNFSGPYMGKKFLEFSTFFAKVRTCSRIFLMKRALPPWNPRPKCPELAVTGDTEALWNKK